MSVLPSAADLVARLESEITRSVDEHNLESRQLVKQQLSIEDGELRDALGPAVLCLGLGPALGKGEDATLAPAVALGLLAHMGRVFAELQGQRRGLSLGWGMPRALNAGDACFALAQDQLNRGSQTLAAESRLLAADMFDSAARALSEALYTGGGQEGDAVTEAWRVLYPHAARLAGIFVGVPPNGLARLEELGEELASAEAPSIEAALARAAALESESA